MKYLMPIFILFLNNAFANPVIIDIGGVRHACTPIEQGNPNECIDIAYKGPFSRSESLDLCAGSYDKSPATCAIEAYRGRYSRAESLTLCKGSTTETGPIDCANLAYNGPFSNAESIELCSHNGSDRTAVCALDAYRGPYSKIEAINLCKNPSVAFQKSMNQPQALSKEKIRELIEETNLKAFERKEYK